MQPVKSSRIVELHYLSSEPREAATIANSFAENFIRMNNERRANVTRYAKEFLETELENARQRLEESELKLVEYAKNKAIYSTDDRQSLVSRKLQQLNEELTKAESQRILAENAYLKSSISNADDRVQKSPLIQALKQARLDLLREYQEKLGIYKPEYPQMITLRERIDQTERELNQEIEREKMTGEEVLYAHYKTARSNEQALREELEKTKGELLVSRDNSIGYNTLSREAETNRELYDGLLQRYKEVSVAGQAAPNDVSIVDPALVPYRTYSPNLRSSLMIALGGGVFLGIVVAFLADFFDPRLRSPETLDKQLGIPLLAGIPRAARRLWRKPDYATLALNQPDSPVAEAYRNLLTQLQFNADDELLQSICITSTVSGEGKSTLALNLAETMGQSGKRVLLIDADLLNPKLHRPIGLDNSVGLADFLAGTRKLRDVICKVPNGHYQFISAGQGGSSGNLLSSLRMKRLLLVLEHSQRFDHIIVKAPPLMGFKDAQILANAAQSTLLVSRINLTRKNALNKACQQLVCAHAYLLGTAVFTDAKDKGQSYYDRYYRRPGRQGKSLPKGKNRKRLSGQVV
ncbi:MAG: polysaccharide biosynthesis tyrosine autokinase [Thiolinea sp.]